MLAFVLIIQFLNSNIRSSVRMTSFGEMLDDKVVKPIQHEKCIGRDAKCWMKCLIAIKLSSNTILAHPTYFFLFLQILRSVKPIQHFIQHAKFMMLDEMLDRFNSALKKGNKNFRTPSKLEIFVKIVNDFQLLTLFAKRSILNV